MDKWYRVRVGVRVRVRAREYTLSFFFVFFFFFFFSFFSLNKTLISALNKVLILALNKDLMCLYRPFIFVTDGVPYGTVQVNSTKFMYKQVRWQTLE